MPNDDGLFGKRSNPTNRTSALVRPDDRRENQHALMRPEQSAALEAIKRGPNMRADAQAVMLKLASYGEGDRRGKFAFNSTELCGIDVAASSRNMTDYEGNVTGTVAFDAIEASPVTGHDGGKLTGVRLRDAVAFMVSKGWAKTTTDGPFAPGTDFHEVALTPEGRNVMHIAATNGGGLPALDEVFMGDGIGGGIGGSTERCDRDAFASMLARAHVKSSTDHDENEGVTIIEIKNIAAFTFDTDGNLVGVGKLDK